MKNSGSATLRSAALAFIFASLVGVSGCESDGPMENAGEEIDDAVEDVQDSTEDAVDEIGDAAENTADEIEDEVDEIDQN